MKFYQKSGERKKKLKNELIMQKIKLNVLINYCKEKNRICPMPNYWNELYDKLKNKKRKGNGWEPALPLILAAWYYTPALLKQLRLIEHLEWAKQQDQLQEISDYLRNLKEEQWFHLGE